MKLLPLVIHGGLHLPRWTDLFSDRLDVASIEVVAGGQTALICNGGHDLPIGSKLAVSITDAETPNPIIAATVDADGNIVCETEFDHDLTFTPDPDRFDPWHETVKVTGFPNPLVNGTRQLVAVPDRTSFVFLPAGDVASISLTGSEVMFDRLDYEIVGWHAATVVDATTLAFPTPATVARSYTVTTPVVVTNIRIAVALHPDAALSQLTMDGDNAVIDKGHIFILPQRVTAPGSAQRVSAGSDYRVALNDGFTVLVFLPSAGTAAHAKAIDKAQGEIFKAMLRTFHGLQLRRSELSCGNVFVSQFESHQGASVTNRAIYAHEYEFQAPAQLVSNDSILPWEWAAIDDSVLDTETPDTVHSIGTGSFAELDVIGILHHGHPSPLTGTYEVDPDS